MDSKQCNICYKIFSSTGNRNAHVRNVHGEARFPCQHCDVKCSTKRLLQNHIRSHTGEKFLCHECPRTFINKENYLRHLSSHGEKNVGYTREGSNWYKIRVICKGITFSPKVLKWQKCDIRTSYVTLEKVKNFSSENS